MSVEPPKDLEPTKLPTTPIGTGERIDSIDVLRGVAVLGILTINILGFGLASKVSTDPTLLGDAVSQADFIAFWGTTIFLEGSQRAIFSMLFGAGVLIFLSRMFASERATHAKKLYFRRTIWLIIFGLVDAYLLLWTGDILFFYGVVGLLLFYVRNWNVRQMLVLVGVILTVLALMRVGFHSLTEAAFDPPEWMKADFTEEEIFELRFSTTPEEIQEEISQRGGGYFSAWLPNAIDSFETQTKVGILMLFWDALSFMLIGMVFLKWRIWDASRTLSFYILMTLLGLGVGLSVNLTEAHLMASSGNLAGPWLYWSYDFGRLGMAIGYIGLFLVICKLQILARMRRVLACVGRMALTNYIMQTVICNTIFVIFGLFGLIPWAYLYLIVVAIWTLQLTYSPIWLKYFKYGPLEWVWRRLTYGNLATQPIKMK